MARTFFVIVVLWTAYACAPFDTTNEASALDRGSDAGAVDPSPVVDANALEASLDASESTQVTQASDDAGDASVDADVEAGSPARVCIQDLSNVGNGNFHVSFRVQTREIGNTTLVYQRNVCAHGAFWDVHLSGDGTVAVELDNDNVSYVALETTATVNDNEVHTVDVVRAYDILTIFIDGASAARAEALTLFGPLAQLGAASGDPCEAAGLYQPLDGSLTDICVSAP